MTKDEFLVPATLLVRRWPIAKGSDDETGRKAESDYVNRLFRAVGAFKVDAFRDAIEAMIADQYRAAARPSVSQVAEAAGRLHWDRHVGTATYDGADYSQLPRTRENLQKWSRGIHVWPPGSKPWEHIEGVLAKHGMEPAPKPGRLIGALPESMLEPETEEAIQQRKDRVIAQLRGDDEYHERVKRAVGDFEEKRRK